MRPKHKGFALLFVPACNISRQGPRIQVSTAIGRLGPGGGAAPAAIVSAEIATIAIAFPRNKPQLESPHVQRAHSRSLVVVNGRVWGGRPENRRDGHRRFMSSGAAVVKVHSGQERPLCVVLCFGRSIEQGPGKTLHSRVLSRDSPSNWVGHHLPHAGHLSARIAG